MDKLLDAINRLLGTLLNHPNGLLLFALCLLAGLGWLQYSSLSDIKTNTAVTNAILTRVMDSSSSGQGKALARAK